MQGINRLLGVAFLAVATALPQGGMAETLADALIAAYRNSNLLDQNRAVLRAADEDVAQAVASLRPVINLQAGVVHNNTRGNIPSDGLSASLSLTAQLTLLDFGRNRASIKAAEASVLASRQSLIGVEQDVLLSAVAAYVNLRQMQDAVGLRAANVRLIGQELRAAQDRFEVGEITRTDVSIAEARLASARAAMAEAQGDLTVARENYQLAIGHPPGSLSPLPRLPATARSLEEARAIALRTHPSIRQLQHMVSVSEANVERAKAEMGPSLTANAAINDRSGGRGIDNQSVGITLNQTIYSGGRISSLYRQALAGRASTRAQLHQAGAIVTQGVGEAWSNLAVARASIAASDEQIRSAQTAYEGVREEARLGARTTLDVLNAEQELLSARTARLSAESVRYTGTYALLAEMGLLTVEHLNLGIPVHDPEAYYNAVRNAPATSSQGRRLDRVLEAIGKTKP
ncbi:MAG: TolC family outer membrane protein [Pseudorhodobacter sp.]